MQISLPCTGAPEPLGIRRVKPLRSCSLFSQSPVSVAPRSGAERIRSYRQCRYQKAVSSSKPDASPWDSSAGPALFVAGSSPTEAFLIAPAVHPHCCSRLLTA